MLVSTTYTEHHCTHHYSNHRLCYTLFPNLFRLTAPWYFTLKTYQSHPPALSTPYRCGAVLSPLSAQLMSPIARPSPCTVTANSWWQWLPRPDAGPQKSSLASIKNRLGQRPKNQLHATRMLNFSREDQMKAVYSGSGCYLNTINIKYCVGRQWANE